MVHETLRRGNLGDKTKGRRTRRWSRLAIASCGVVSWLAASCSTLSFAAHMKTDKLQLWLVTGGVTAVLLFFFSFPLIFILYGGAAGVIGGAIMLAPIIAVQYLFLMLFRRLSSGSPPVGKK